MLNRFKATHIYVLATALTTAALSLTCEANAADGRIVANNDEWTLSNAGYGSPDDPDQFILSSVGWMAGAGPKNLLIFSNNFGLTGSLLQATLTGAGHSVTTTTNAAEFANIANYDVVLTVGVIIDNQVLIDYVHNGGNVYIAFGTGYNVDFTFDAFLNEFGIGQTHSYNNVGLSVAVSSAHPIFAGVDHLFFNNGNSLFDLAGRDAADVVLSTGANGLIAVYDGGGSGCVAVPDIDGSGHVDASDLAVLLGSWGTSDCESDLDGSGSVNASDLAILLGAWG